MKKLLACALATMLVAACAHAPQPKPAATTAAVRVQDISGAIVVGPDDFMAGTIAGLNTFEFEAAPVYTKLVMVRHESASLEKSQRITKEHAMEVLTQADKVRAQLDQAVTTCKQNNSTGKCTGNSALAHQQLQSARSLLDQIH